VPRGTMSMLVLMFVIASLMFRYVERRFIHQPETPPVAFWKYSARFWSIILPMVAITHATFLSKGFAWRLPPEQAKLAHLQEFPSGEDLEPVDGPFAMQLVGDSHAVHYLAGLSPLMKRLGIKLEPLAYPGCLILYGVRLKKTLGDYARCAKSQDSALERIGKTNFPVVLVQRWQFYDDATIDFTFDSENDSHSEKYSYTKLEHALERTISQIIGRGRHI
jgi:hypothetical protein